MREPDAAVAFCEPSLRHLHNPADLPGIVPATERILAALHHRQQLVIYGDYDVDGITAATILYLMCRAIAPDAPITTFVPHRLDEGYGLHVDAIDRLADEGARVIISVDCGITALEPARHARNRGVDLIITDHHNLPDNTEDLPPAFGLIHPRLPGSIYPFRELCGAGVAFKLAWHLAATNQGSDRVGEDFRELLLDLLALAALGTIADIVPLIDENRVIARFGLSRIRHTSLLGLNTLIEASGLGTDRVSEEHVGFVLGPRLNACGRMGHAREALELFTTADPRRAREIAEHLTTQNDQRRATERRIFDQAVELAGMHGMTGPDRRAIVLAHPDWHPGVVGIVCSRLVSRFHRPAILMQDDGETCRGSGRSIEGFNLHHGLACCRQWLQSFGGHDMAAGVALPSSKLPRFAEAFIEHANASITDDQLTPTLRVDCGATLAECSPAAVGQLVSLGPFGQANPRPTVLVRGLSAPAGAQSMGSGGAHLSMHARQDNRTMRMIAWKWGQRIDVLPPGASFDAVICPKLNTWNGRTTVEAEIQDIRLHSA